MGPVTAMSQCGRSSQLCLIWPCVMAAWDDVQDLYYVQVARQSPQPDVCNHVTLFAATAAADLVRVPASATNVARYLVDNNILM